MGQHVTRLPRPYPRRGCTGIHQVYQQNALDGRNDQARLGRTLREPQTGYLSLFERGASGAENPKTVADERPRVLNHTGCDPSQTPA